MKSFIVVHMLIVVILSFITISVKGQDQQIQYQNILIDGPGNHNQLPQVAVYDTVSGSGSSGSGSGVKLQHQQQQHSSSGGIGNVQGKQYSQSVSSASANAASSGYPYSDPPKYKAPQSTYTQPQQPQQNYSPVKQQEESYAYYYQHMPMQQQQSQNPYGQEQQQQHGLSPHGDSDLLGGFGDFGGAGALGGIGGLGALGIAGLAALAKGALAIKPLLIFALLFLLALPLLIIFLPIPIITIDRPGLAPAPANPSMPVMGRSARQLFNSAMTTIQEKFLDSEECLERIICKVPSLTVPKKYQSTAASLWNEYGSKYISNTRIRRGLDAYFNNNSESTSNVNNKEQGKKKISKCNQQFKCNNKYL